MNFQATEVPQVDLSMIVVDEMLEKMVAWDLPPLPVIARHPAPRRRGVKRA